METGSRRGRVMLLRDKQTERKGNGVEEKRREKENGGKNEEECG